jgi:hypothetical protein
MSLPHASSRISLPRSNSSADCQLPMIESPQGTDANHQTTDCTSQSESPQHSQLQVPANDAGILNPQTQRFRIDPREGFFHAMLSYRVVPDKDFITKVHDKVHLLGPVARSSQAHQEPSVPSNLDTYPWPAAFRRDKSVCSSFIRLFQDAFCLKDGQEWEGDGDSQSGGFVGALKLSLVFVPLFSATVDQGGRSIGSVGLMIDLENNDKQDNVLLELILARELHLQSKRVRKSALFPCSQILPLFQSDAVWAAAAKLPKKPSAITNEKALAIMKSMGTPDSNISEELRSNTLTVADVWSFYGQFQGIKLYERGNENYQVEAAAHAIIQSINEAVSNFKFHDLDMNYAQMYELCEFLSALNMANYTKILACHKITNVFELSNLNTQEDSVVKLIAEHGLQPSDSTLAAELVKLRSAIAAAKNSRFSKSLNDRLRDFIDEDASLATLTQSASVVDNGLSKPIFLAVVFLVFFEEAISSFAELHRAQDSRNFINTYFPNSRASRMVYLSCCPVFNVIMCIAVVIARFRSPRHGRYVMSFALFYASCLFFWLLAVSIRSAVENDFEGVAEVNQLVVAQNSVALQILEQPWFGVPLAVASGTLLFRQDLFVQVSLAATVLVCVVPGIVFFVYFRSFRHTPGTAYFYNAATFLGIYGLTKLLLYIGNQRAKQIYAMNETKTLRVYEKVCSKFKDSNGFSVLSSRPASSHPISWSLSRLIRRKQLNRRKLTSTELQTFGAQPSAFWGQEIIGEGTIYQSHSSFENLVRDAEFINYPFQEWVSSWLTGGPHEDKIKKHLHHGPNSVDTAFVNLSYSGLVASVKLVATTLSDFDYVLFEDVRDPSNLEAPLIASAGDKLDQARRHKLQSAGVKEVYVVSSIDANLGVHKRGPERCDYVLVEDVPDPSNLEAPLIASAGDTLAKELLEKLRSAGVKEVSVASSIDANHAILGMHKRGPVKHVDRAIAKVQCRNTFQVHRIELFPAGLPLIRRQFQAPD